MTADQPIDVQRFIDARGLSHVQVLLLVLCFLVVALDGFDTIAIGFIAPAIRAEWGATPAQLAPLFGAGLFGLMIGAFAFGPLADRLGRRAILALTVLFFGVASLASALAPSIGMLTLLRFVTGLGLGGALPNAITLTSEYSPEGRRSSLVMIMFSGFALGAALSGVASAHLIAAYGWRSVLVLGGVLPLLLAPVLWVILPESVLFLVMRGDRDARVAATLRRVAPDAVIPAGARFVGAGRPEKLPVGELFRRDLRMGTLILWLTFFMSLLFFYLLGNWLPTLLHSTGVSLRTASLVTALFYTGGVLGGVTLGRIMDKSDPHRVLGVTYALAGALIIALGNVATVPWLVAPAVFGAGFCTGGCQIGIHAVAAAYYPTTSRATGVGWASGVGRLGSVLGSMLGGVLLSPGRQLSTILAIVAVPAFVAAASMLAMGRREIVIHKHRYGNAWRARKKEGWTDVDRRRRQRHDRIPVLRDPRPDDLR
jgi:MFS transporter, AAHS family, 4-hydroxybenzoate transporter